MINKARIMLFLKGLLQGLFLTAFITGAAIGLNVVLLLFVIFVSWLILVLLDQADNLYSIAGIIVGVLLAVLVAAVSPAALGGVSAALIALALVVLIIG